MNVRDANHTSKMSQIWVFLYLVSAVSSRFLTVCENHLPLDSKLCSEFCLDWALFEVLLSQNVLIPSFLRPLEETLSSASVFSLSDALTTINGLVLDPEGCKCCMSHVSDLGFVTVETFPFDLISEHCFKFVFHFGSHFSYFLFVFLFKNLTPHVYFVTYLARFSNLGTQVVFT